jgi:peptidoglycan/LPS O-acetylase OafA/YrhL
MVLVIVSLTLLFNPEMRVGLPRDSAAALSWTTNLYLIANGSSYMEQLNPDLFTHTWFLALQMQYYLLWGLILFTVIRAFRGRSRHAQLKVRVLGVITIGLSVLMTLGSWILSIQLISTQTDKSFVYMMLFTHAVPLAIGSAFAGLKIISDSFSPTTVTPTHSVKHSRILKTRPTRRILTARIISVLAWIAGVSYGLLTASLYSDWYFVWGQLLIGLLTALILFTFRTVKSEIVITKWIGTRAYSIYLFHYPLFYVTHSLWLSLGLTLILSEIAYRWIEMPWNQPRTAIRAVSERLPGSAGFSKPAICVQLLASLLIFTTGFAWVTAPWDTYTEREILAQSRLNAVANVATTTRFLSDLKYNSPILDNANQDLWPDPPSILANRGAEKADAARLKADRAIAIMNLPSAPAIIVGDSVCLNASAQIREAIPGIYIDCEVSRFAATGLDILKKLDAGARLPRTIIVQLSTNVRADSWDAMSEIVKLFSPTQKLILVTGYGLGAKYNYMNDFAKFLKDLAKSHPQVHIADWASLIKVRPDLLSADGFHPGNNEARWILANEILRTYNQ